MAASQSEFRIARLSRGVAALLTLALWLLPVGIAVYVLLFPQLLPFHPWVAAAGISPRPLPLGNTVAVLAVLMISASPAIWGLWELRRLFQGYAAGAIFTVAAARRLCHCAYSLLALGVIAPFGALGLSLALSADLPPGARKIAISISSDDLGLLLMGIILLVIARVMGEAARLAEENAGFV
jgi:hypothetical protein